MVHGYIHSDLSEIIPGYATVQKPLRAIGPTMRAISVLLRPHDERNADAVCLYMDRCGLLIGAKTTSQVIRHALSLAVRYIEEVESAKQSTGNARRVRGSRESSSTVKADQVANTDAGTGQSTGYVANEPGHDYRLRPNDITQRFE